MQADKPGFEPDTRARERLPAKGSNASARSPHTFL